VSGWIVETDALTRRFGRFVAVDRLTLRIPRGSIFGLLGPTGCGKSTTIRMLCGLLKPTSGRALVGDCDVARDPEAVRERLGYMAQRFSLYPDMTVRENLEFYGGIYGLERRDLAARIDQVLGRLDLTARADDLTESLPLGWKQRVALGAAVLHEPPVLLLDEPTSGVDPASRRFFWEILDDLRAAGASVLVTTHTMEEAERCEEVAIMHGGELVAAGAPADLKEQFSGTLYEFDAEPLLTALEAAKRLPQVIDAVLFGTALHLTVAAGDPAPLRRALEAGGVAVHNVRAIQPTLEDVFVQQIAGRRRDRPDAAGGIP